MGESDGAMGGGFSAEDVHAELNRLLESPAFRTSRRCREFLEYIVEHTLSGPTGTLKERSIGVELFQLPRDFDTGQHTIVRVTANEVRKKLAQYYLAENHAHHPLRIGLPPGSYSAEFTSGAQPSEAASQPEIPLLENQASEETLVPEETQDLADSLGTKAPARRARYNRWAITLGTLVFVIVAVVSLWGWRAVKPPSAAKSTPPSGFIPKSWSGAGDLRIIVGSTSPYTDRSGRIWAPDRFFSGGSVLARPSERILRTLDPDIYRRVRTGDFRYDIPLEPGSYELRLHFAETLLVDFISAESSGEGQRLFRVTVNGKPILDWFDIVADANGANTADVRVFRNISPEKDGFLHLNFVSERGTASLTALEVLPVGRAGEVRPVRIRAGFPAAWQDPAGHNWQADSYFLGGNALVRTTNPVRGTASVSPEMALYASERWGHFSYSVPVADGRYRVTLRFCEGHYGRANTGVGGLGSRVFDVYCNGVALLRNFDIIKEADGEGRPIDRTFSGVRPTAQGKIVLTFVPNLGMACVNGIEVVEEPK